MKALLRSTVARATTLYTFLSVLPALVNFLLLPLYLNYLSVESYGYLALLNLFALLYSVFASMQLNIAAGNQYFTLEEAEKTPYRHALFQTNLLSCVLMFLLFLALGPTFFRIYENDLPFAPLGALVLGTTMIRQINNLVMVFMKNEYRLKVIGRYALAITLLNVCLQVIALVFLKMGLAGIIKSTFLSTLVVTTVLLIQHRNWLWRKGTLLSGQAWRYAIMGLKFSLPFLPAVLVFQGQVAMDRIVLERYGTLAMVGQFALLMTLLSIPNMFVDALIKAIRPKVLGFLKNGEEGKVRQLERCYVGVVCFIFLGALVVGTHLHLVTDSPKYQEIGNYVLLGVAALLPGSLLYFKHLRIMFRDQSGAISRYSIIAAAIQFVLLWMLVPTYHVNGALIATGVAGLVNYALLASNDASGNVFPHEFRLLRPALGLGVLLGIGAGMRCFDLSVSATSITVFITGTALLYLSLKSEWANLATWIRDPED